MPQHHKVIPHCRGSSKELEVEHQNAEDYSKGIKRDDSFCSRLSSQQDIPLLLPQEPEEPDASYKDLKMNGNTTTSRSISLGFRKSKVEFDVSDMPLKGFVDDYDHAKMFTDILPQNVTRSDMEWWEMQERRDQVGFDYETGQVGPRTSCRCQVCCSMYV